MHKSLILHHFESKEGLWRAVKNRCLQEFTEEQSRIFQRDEVSLEEFKQTIRAYFKLLQRNPAMVQLLSWAELERDTQCSQFEHARLNTFHQRLQQAQTQGLIRQEVNTAHLLLLLINGITQWFEARHMFQDWEPLHGDQDIDEAFLSNLIQMVLMGVASAREKQG